MLQIGEDSLSVVTMQPPAKLQATLMPAKYPWRMQLRVRSLTPRVMMDCASKRLTRPTKNRNLLTWK